VQADGYAVSMTLQGETQPAEADGDFSIDLDGTGSNGNEPFDVDMSWDCSTDADTLSCEGTFQASAGSQTGPISDATATFTRE